MSRRGNGAWLGVGIVWAAVIVIGVVWGLAAAGVIQ